MFHLLGKGDDLPPAAEADAKQLGQGADQLDDVHGLMFLSHPVDGVEGIVEKVGVDLRLQGAYLRLALVALLLVDHLQKAADLVHHAVEAAAELANFAKIAPRVERHVQIAALGLGHQPPQLADRPHERGRKAQAHHRGQHDEHRGGDDGETAQGGHLLRRLAEGEHAHRVPLGDVRMRAEQLVALPVDDVYARRLREPFRADAVDGVVHRRIDDLAGAVLHEDIAALAQRHIADALLDGLRAHVGDDHAQQLARLRVLHGAHDADDAVGGIVAVMADVAADGPGDKHALAVRRHRLRVPRIAREGVAGDAVEVVGGVEAVFPRHQQPAHQRRVHVGKDAHAVAHRRFQTDAARRVEVLQSQVVDHVLVHGEVLEHAVHRAHGGFDVHAHLFEHLGGKLGGLLVKAAGVEVIAQRHHQKQRHGDEQRHVDQQLFLQAEPLHAHPSFSSVRRFYYTRFECKCKEYLFFDKKGGANAAFSSSIVCYSAEPPYFTRSSSAFSGVMTSVPRVMVFSSSSPSTSSL